MASKIRIKMSRAGERELMRNRALVEGRAQAVADACNAESSWGGYASGVSVSAIRARATVWTYARQDGAGSTERAQRMIKNLGAGG